MSTDPLSLPRPLPALLTQVKQVAVQRMRGRMEEAGFGDVREGHGCVFGFIDIERGSRLTDLAERSGLTKQAVGEAVAELERKGYLQRVPDPEDGRAKIIRLTERGQEACVTGHHLFEETEREWVEQLGEDLVACLRRAAEQIAELEGLPDYRLTGSTAVPS
jgi:DNA-binding MarR family transcriptional regulator